MTNFVNNYLEIPYYTLKDYFESLYSNLQLHYLGHHYLCQYMPHKETNDWSLITVLPSYQQDFEAMVDTQLITMFSRNLKSFCEVVVLVQDISLSILNAYCLQCDHPLWYHIIELPDCTILAKMQRPHLSQPSPPLWSKLPPPSNMMTPKGTKENLKIVLAIEQDTSTPVGVKYYLEKVVSIYDYTPKF